MTAVEVHKKNKTWIEKYQMRPMEDLKVQLYIHITSEYECNLCIVAMTLTNKIMIHQRNKAPLFEECHNTHSYDTMHTLTFVWTINDLWNK